MLTRSTHFTEQKKTQLLLMKKGFSLFTWFRYTFTSKEPWRFDAKEITGVLKFVQSDVLLSLPLDQQAVYLNFLLSLQNDIHFSIAQAGVETLSASSDAFKNLFTEWLDFLISYPDGKVYIHTICARATDQVYLDCFNLIKLSSLHLVTKKYIAGQLFGHWRRFNRNCDLIFNLAYYMPIAYPTVTAAEVVLFDVNLEDNRNPTVGVLDQNQSGVGFFLPLSPKDEQGIRDFSQQLPIACGFKPLFVLPGFVECISLSEAGKTELSVADRVLLTNDPITAANDSKNLFEQDFLITFCTEPDLQQLKSLLGSFNTFLPKRFFGDVPAGMKEVIALIENNAPTNKILNKLRDIAKNRTGQNMWHTRQGKTIEAYKAIDEFFSGNLQEKKMEDLLDALSNIIAPKEPMVPPVLTEVSL